MLFQEHTVQSFDTLSRAVAERLSRCGGLDEPDLELIRCVTPRAKDMPSGVCVPVQRSASSAMIVTGWVGRVRLLADGRRQVVSALLPGDIVGAHPNPMVHLQTVSLTDIRVVDLNPLYDALNGRPDRHTRLRRAIAVCQKVEEAHLVEQVIRLGRRTAFERMGHWLLDVNDRLNGSKPSAGPVRFAMPLIQETIGDVLGLSLVHVNRIVQRLKRERLAEIKSGHVTILDPERLKIITE